MGEPMQDKIAWMKSQLENDGFDEINEEYIVTLLEDKEECDNPALVYYILELESEWATNGNISS